MLVGIPTAGKSTFSNDPKYKNYIRVSSDDILQEVAKERQQSYNTVFKGNIRFAQIAMMKVLRSSTLQENRSILYCRFKNRSSEEYPKTRQSYSTRNIRKNDKRI